MTSMSTQVSRMGGSVLYTIAGICLALQLVVLVDVFVDLPINNFFAAIGWTLLTIGSYYLARDVIIVLFGFSSHVSNEYIKLLNRPQRVLFAWHALVYVVIDILVTRLFRRTS